MKQFILIRTTWTENQINGILFIIKENSITHISKTIENRHTIFPGGKYNIKWEYSPKFEQDLWEIKGIKGRSEIKIHNGTKWQHSLGCIIISKSNLEMLHATMNDTISTTIKIIQI